MAISDDSISKPRPDQFTCSLMSRIAFRDSHRVSVGFNQPTRPRYTSTTHYQTHPQVAQVLRKEAQDLGQALREWVSEAVPKKDEAEAAEDGNFRLDEEM